MKFINWIKQKYLLLIILIVSAILRIYNLDFQSLWVDELYTINDTNPNLSISEVYDAACKEAAPTIYFLIVNLVFKIFGYTAFVMRMVSVVFGLAGILAIYFLGKEVFNKKVGIYSSILLAVNYFHLYYSQEARIYTFWFLVTIVSFYMLIRFIKNPTFKTALLYGLSSSLMLYGHYFALFALVAQYLILLFFVIKPFHIKRIKFFIYCFIAGLTNLVLFLPLNYSVLTRVNGINSFWIPKPTTDVFTQVFKDFFGQSEIVLFFVIILIIIYFIQLFKQKETEKFEINPNENKFVFGFLVLFTWILITLLIPLIRSYTTVPMLVNRYFLDILPAILILISIGLYYVRNVIVRYFILGMIIVFSLTDIIIVKKYYTTVAKTQFRELSNFIIDHNKTNDPVVSSVSGFFPFYLNNEKVKMNLIDNPLEVYINRMIQDSLELKPFWYVDAHGRTYDVSEKPGKFLAQEFILDNSVTFYNAWAHHYSLINGMTLEKIDISKYSLIAEKSGDELRYYIDAFATDLKTISTNGWIYFTNQDATDTEITVAMIKDTMAYKIPFIKQNRNDVAEYYKLPINLTNCGFKVHVLHSVLPVGKYQLAFIIKNAKTKKEGFALTNKTFTKE